MDKILMTGVQDGFFILVKEALVLDYELITCEFVNSSIRRNIKMEKPDLIICFKPLNASISSIRELKDEFPSLPLIVVCERDDTDMVHYPGVRPCILSKPVRFDVINSWIEKLLAEKPKVVAKKRILAVDDESLVLRTIKAIISSKYDITFATSGIKALEMMERETFDLVLLDYEMPYMNGCEVFQDMRNDPNMENIPVIFLTGVSDKERIMEVVTYRPAGYLLKPIDSDRLLQAVADVLNK